MDFLEEFGYTHLGKRLRKRLPHYSRSFIESQPCFAATFQLLAGSQEQTLETISDRALEHVKHLSIGIGRRPSTRTTTTTSFVASPKLAALIDERIKRYLGVLRVEPWLASDHYSFYSLPATFEWISGEKLAKAAQFGLDLIKAFDKQDLSWSRPKR